MGFEKEYQQIILRSLTQIRNIPNSRQQKRYNENGIMFFRIKMNEERNKRV